MRRGRRLAATLLALAFTPLVAGAAVGSPIDAGPDLSVARLTDSATTTQSITTDTLDPPTSLSATGGLTAALAWTATVDTYATGYKVARATVSGGPYSVVSTVTPRTIVSTTDAPTASGTYYYVLQSYFQSWTSANSNQTSAVVTLAQTATGFKSCTAASNAADTGGDGNGYETTPGNGCVVDAAVATDANSGTNTTVACANAGKDRHRYWDYNLGVPASVLVVAGIQVRANIGENNTTGTTQICAELSWDGGTTWTAPKSVALTASAITAYTLGATNDTWGRTWLGSEFANGSFRVRITDVTNQTTKSFRLDGLAVQVTYTP